MTSDEKQCREAFEKWYGEKEPNASVDNTLLNILKDARWEAWQAGVAWKEKSK